MKTLCLACLFVAIATASSGQTPAATGPAACAALRGLQVPGASITVTSAEWFPSGSPVPPAGPFSPAPPGVLPAYCRLDGVLDRRTGADGVEYGIGFALALPAAWNGRFLFQGGSVFNGFVAPPLGVEAAGDTPALARGFAVVSTDTGHRSPAPFDATFMREQQANIDFAYQAVERVAAIAKDIVARHYARPAAYSYFTGCSTGGREGMQMAQRRPASFDGIVSGAPAMRTSYSVIGNEWVTVALNQSAPVNASRQPLTREALSASDKRIVIDGVINACDAADGLRDGMVFNTRACRFDPKVLVCDGAKREGCLSAAQAAALERAAAGPKDARGKQVYPGFPFDTGIAATQGLPGWLHGGLSGSTATTIDVDRAARMAAEDAQAMLTNTFAWTNLNTFASRGGKLLLYHGVSDSTFSAFDTIDYVQRLADANGGAAEASRWTRLFLSPGMGHCRGGDAALDSFDLLTAVVNWVENGVAPDQVRATGQALPGRSRPLCAYPRYAHFTGRGDPQDAASFECRAP